MRYLLIYIVIILSEANAQPMDTLLLLATAIHANANSLQDIARRSDYSHKNVVCIRVAYKALPHFQHRIMEFDSLNIVATGLGELFHEQVREFITVNKIQRKGRRLIYNYQHENMKEEVFKRGIFVFERKAEEWIYSGRKEITQ